MPNYNAQNPPNSIFPGDVVRPFDGETPAAPQASQQYALADAWGASSGQGQDLRVDISYAAAPTAVSVQIQTAIDDVEGDYFTEYTSTNVAGESVKLTDLRARFVRVLLESQTGGGAITVRLAR